MRNPTISLRWTVVGCGLALTSPFACTSPEREFNARGDASPPTETVEVESDAAPATEETDASVGEVTNPTDSTSTADPTQSIVVGLQDAGPGSSSSSTASTSEPYSSSPVSSTTTQPEPDSGVSCVPVLDVEGSCTDHVDDDCDGLLDCEDAVDCGTSLDCLVSCVPSGESEATCNDQGDDDCDGFIDCDDIDCTGAGNCKTDCTPKPEDCTDGEDNDCDGFTDCLDSACAAGAACCSSSGPEVCSDGIDNNCDGVIDCPEILSAVPELPAEHRRSWEGGAVSTDKALLTLEMPRLDRFIVQCRSGKPPEVSSKQFVVCNPLDPSALDVAPLSQVDPTNPLYNGLVTTQVRLAYANGQVSQPTSYTYYVHNSLAGAESCAPKASDEDYFSVASAHLVSASDPFADEEAHLVAPFINVQFKPRVGYFDVEEGDGPVEYLSLRHRFVLSEDKNLLLMKRVYGSRRAWVDDCRATTIRKHARDLGPSGNYDATRNFRNGCDTIVMNRSGAGVCLVVDGNNAIAVANPNSSQWQRWNFTTYGWVNWPTADNFLWRKLKRVQPDGSFVAFSPKCYDGGISCTGGNPNVLFLPDRPLFSL